METHDAGRARRRPVLVLLGPTASGKTDLLLSVFAGNGRGEGKPKRPGLPPAVVVSADSMQAYRGMDIGTAKPSPEERSLLPHRLIDIRDPDEQYGVGDFVGLADAACGEILEAGALPVISGGTGFYIRNFIFRPPRLPGRLGRVPGLRRARFGGERHRGPASRAGLRRSREP